MCNKKKTTANDPEMQRFEHPFVHYVQPGFLSNKEHETVSSAYQKLEFYEKYTDLFHFFQTNELCSCKEMRFFVNKTEKWMKSIYKTKRKTWMNVFASLYFRNNYLLCHDDLVENRKFAFSYYLDDFESGDLVFYGKDAVEEAKRIRVERNLLVVFEVSPTSFHEVDTCKTDGRKAITGWFNVEGCNRNLQSIVSVFSPRLYTGSCYPLEVELDDDFVYVPEICYDFCVASAELEGPFHSRRVERLSLQDPVVFSLKGFVLLSADFYNFRKHDYVLLNDTINAIGGDILDVWIVQRKVDDRTEKTAIKYIADDGCVFCEVPLVSCGIFCVRRRLRNVFVERAAESFFLAHFVYRRTVHAIGE